MMTNPDKFRASFFNKAEQNKTHKLMIHKNFGASNSVQLLGLEVDLRLLFDKHLTESLP